TMSSGTAGSIYYTLDGSDPRLPGGAISPSALIYNSGQTLESLVNTGSTWRYWDNGALPASNWMTAQYSDSAWGEGSAELGYGDGDESTVLDYGPNAAQKYITTYFRKTFSCADASSVNSLALNLLRDDGAVIYLNGIELARHNMPAGQITSETLASSAVGNAEESIFYPLALPSSLLQTGENLLAIEVHQADLASSDLSFNLGLNSIENNAALTLAITSNTVIRSRIWTGSEWSALNEARFLMEERVPAAIGNLMITELHYNPSGYLDDHEFIEIWNASPNLVDLTGVTLSGGVTYTFPDGFVLDPFAFAVIVENEFQFQDRYQIASSPWYHAGITVCGKWSGKLGNSGEQIALLAANGAEILTVSYKTDTDWPQRANGKGSSLEVKAPLSLPPVQPAKNQQLASGTAWQSSALNHGSPGRFDAFPRDVVINEILSHTDAETDWIELYNTANESVDISGFYLSDNFDMPFRYSIPAETLIPAKGYLSIGATELGFAFSELGSDALLLTAAGTNVMRFVDTVDFPAVAREEPFGRCKRSDGEYDFTELVATSRDMPNTAPRIGPLVFSEIMYGPETGKVEYVKIENLTEASVPQNKTTDAAGGRRDGYAGAFLRYPQFDQ
ncbi:MAG: lamin tail domain-containing protein, partial [Verrucomicrobia bacterium]|nr:lamin tail domain-containing protein [Verrucomicrobiota bacterium]